MSIKVLLISTILISMVCCKPSNEKSPMVSTLQDGTSECAAFSGQRLARLDTFLKNAVNEGWLPGAEVLIARKGFVIKHVAYGYSDIENGVRLKKNEIYRLASMTKAIVSVGVMILYDEGHFVLDDPIAKFLPEFKNSAVLDRFDHTDSSYTTVPARREITIRDLLTHTSGISYGSYDPRMAVLYGLHIPLFGCSEELTSRTFTKRLAALPLEHHPGEKFTYGLGTDVLGVLIEVVSKMTLNDFLHARIFEPLRMNDTYFRIPPEKANRLVKAYSEVAYNSLVPLSPKTDDWPNAQGYPLSCNLDRFYSGGSGLSGTAKDYAIFTQMLLNKGTYDGKRILSPKTVSLMSMNHIEGIPVGELGQSVFGKGGFGLGFSVVTEEALSHHITSSGRLGWGGYFGTLFWLDPTEDLLVVLMTQVSPAIHTNLHEVVEILTYQALESNNNAITF